jgi:hypothetical protein
LSNTKLPAGSATRQPEPSSRAARLPSCQVPPRSSQGRKTSASVAVCVGAPCNPFFGDSRYASATTPGRLRQACSLVANRANVHKAPCRRGPVCGEVCIVVVGIAQPLGMFPFIPTDHCAAILRCFCTVVGDVLPPRTCFAVTPPNTGASRAWRTWRTLRCIRA